MIAALGREAVFHLFTRAAADGAAGPRVADATRLLGDRRILSFARGLSIGALVGAAIAGLGFWGRLRAHHD